MQALARAKEVRERFVAYVGGAGVCGELGHLCAQRRGGGHLAFAPLQRDTPVGEPVLREDVDGRALPRLRPRRPLPVLFARVDAGAGEHVTGADARQVEERLVAGVRREECMHAIIELLV
jgi:hypothetical protein